MEQPIFTGLLEDDRSEAEKKKDFLHDELDAGAGAEYLQFAEAKKSASRYTKLNQRSTSSCVAHSAVLALGIDNETEGEGFVDLSPAYIYRQRVGFPSEGMNYHDLGKITRENGACITEMLPTPPKESQINSVQITEAMKENGRTYRPSNYILMVRPTIDQLKDVANGLNEGILLSIFANRSEWATDYPKIEYPNLIRSESSIRHCVTVLPNSAYQKNGKRYVIIQDSAWFGGENIRHVSEDFIAKRARFGMYFLNLPNPNPSEEKRISFSYRFTRNLTVGDRGDDVVMLQRALKELGFFTFHTATGYFGGITRKAVIDFQEYYANDVLKYFGLSKGTGFVGRTTKVKLHKLMV